MKLFKIALANNTPRLLSGEPNPCYQKYYICTNRSDVIPNSNAYLGNKQVQYLHSDGVWRTTALNQDKSPPERYSGYYETMMDAEIMLAGYLLTNLVEYDVPTDLLEVKKVSNENMDVQ